MTTASDKVAPHSKESEMIVLGSMLTNTDSLNIGCAGLDKSDFYLHEHKIIFQVLQTFYLIAKPVDIHLIGEELKRQDKLKAAGDIGYLTTLAQFSGTSSYIEEYIKLVRHQSVLRRLINISQDAIQKSLNNPEDVPALIDNIKEKILNVEQSAKFEQQPQKISLEFICEHEVNYLFDEEPEMPRLINFIENGKQKPFIPKGIVAQLVGAGGVGKTHALAQLAISVTTGTNWLGVYPIEKPGYVFMGLGENKPEDIHRLLKKIVKGQISNPDATFFEKDPLQEASKRLSVKSFTGIDSTFIRNGLQTSTYDSFLQALKDKEPEEGWSVIILDPISRFMGADAENDNAAATQFITLLERITLDLKGQPTVIFGHHMNKSGISGKVTDQGAARGSSAITDGVRWQANLERVQKEDGKEGELEFNKIVLRSVKSNFTAILSPQTLTKDENGCLKGETGQPPPRVIATKKK